MESKLITDKTIAKHIFTQGNLTEDKNSENYTLAEFEKGWRSWTAFFVLYDGHDTVAFCGVRKFGDRYVRVFDRYFVFPEYRRLGLNNAEHSMQMIKQQLNFTDGRTPFFSIESSRSAVIRAVRKFNTVIDNRDHFQVLDGLYNTAGSSMQHIAIKKPHTTINL